MLQTTALPPPQFTKRKELPKSQISSRRNYRRKALIIVYAKKFTVSFLLLLLGQASQNLTLGHHSTWVELLLYNSFLAIYFTHGNVCFSATLSVSTFCLCVYKSVLHFSFGKISEWLHHHIPSIFRFLLLLRILCILFLDVW